jgi:hypothetical protein
MLRISLAKTGRRASRACLFRGSRGRVTSVSALEQRG